MSAITAPVRAAWGWFKLAVIIAIAVLGVLTGWDWADAEAVGGHLWGIVVILWEGLVNIVSAAADQV